MGDTMKGIFRFAVLAAAVAGISISAIPASASPSSLKCNSNKDRIWVYESLTTFDVQAKVDCAEPVEVLARQDGYVKIRTHSGVVGYVQESAFADELTGSMSAAQVPAQAQQNSAPTVGAVARQAQAQEIAKVRAANSVFAADSQPVAAAAANGPVRASLMTSSGLAEMKRPAPASSTVVAEPVNSDSAPSRSAAPAAGASSNAASDSAPTAVEKLAAAGSDTSCQSYFSAYGLNSDQLKWIAFNRKKLFPGICPAPNASQVKFVMIFTHDVSFFSATMPQSIHNIGGFSDFQPLTPVDNALVSESDADHAHRQYVWIFQYPDGGFNPDTFSPHSQAKFAKVESNGPKVLEEALRFVETAAH
jgi:hypothetical protein